MVASTPGTCGILENFNWHKSGRWRDTRIERALFRHRVMIIFLASSRLGQGFPATGPPTDPISSRKPSRTSLASCTGSAPGRQDLAAVVVAVAPPLSSNMALRTRTPARVQRSVLPA
ncbi:hypothetical protein OE88DRAFT_909485 [Heliocybe sulcata]|uniref:Uncharacterized protein n=1 Tax=Heliocybe sulcata TaxID=5364 RepID=A0A5C3MYL6_9AGAM|nr:hypothetical protein OE88DRAFT_909485 [Heliocybe sulcata]